MTKEEKSQMEDLKTDLSEKITDIKNLVFLLDMSTNTITKDEYRDKLRKINKIIKEIEGILE